MVFKKNMTSRIFIDAHCGENRDRDRVNSILSPFLPRRLLPPSR